MKADTLIVIPARYASSRFPGKPLLDIWGKSMIQRVYEQCQKVRGCEVMVATDDERIKSVVEAFGGQVLMTSSNHQTGTERVGEVAEKKTSFPYIINVQGDEPFIEPKQIESLKELLEESASVATLVRPLADSSSIESPHVVKAAYTPNGRVLYFSRSPIPFQRNPQTEFPYYQHIGIYGFQRETLLKLIQLKPTPLELTESLEQLRWLENGYEIRAKVTSSPTFAIDTPEDLEKLLAQRGKWERNVEGKR